MPVGLHLELADPALDHPLALVLQRQVEGGDHLQPVLVERARPEALLDLLGDAAEHEVRRLDLEAVRLEDELRLGGGVGLIGRDRAGAHHQRQHLLLPQLGEREVVDRVEAHRGLWDAGQQRRLRQRQLGRGLPEVALGRRLDPHVDPAVGDRVEVPLEDLVLLVLARQLQRDHRLLELAVDGALGALLARDVDVLRELLCDGGAARALQEVVAEGREVLQRGARQAAHVQAVVLVEALVLRGDGRLHQPRRDLGERDGAPQPRELVDELVEQSAVAVVDAGAAARQLVQQLRRRHDALGDLVVAVDAVDGGAAGTRQRDDEQQRADARRDQQPAPTAATAAAPAAGGVLASGASLSPLARDPPGGHDAAAVVRTASALVSPGRRSTTRCERPSRAAGVCSAR